MTAFARALLLMMLVLVSAAARADDCFELSGRRQCLALMQGHEIGGPCALERGVLSCGAARALRNARQSQVSSGELSGGKEPGAVLCQKLGARLVIGSDRFRNQQAFCTFSDGSFVTPATLWNEAGKN